MSQNKITFGDGDSDHVSVGSSSRDAITFGNGLQDRFDLSGKIDHDTITFGNGADDVATVLGNSSYDTVKFGYGDFDYLYIWGSSSDDTVNLGNGSNDYVNLEDTAHDLIIVESGNSDNVFLGVSSVTAVGGDTVITGTGAHDTVTVEAHSNADTFGFALGTNGSSFTTVFGAQVGDHVVSGNDLGNNAVSETGTFASLSDFFSFVTGLHPASGDTYIGRSNTDTFVITDSHGQFGAVDIVGVFTGSTGGTHELTLA